MLLYLAMERVFYNADKQFLSDEVTIIKTILRSKPNNFSALQQEIDDIPHSLKTSVYHYYVTVAHNNETILSTSSFPLFLKNKIYSRYDLGKRNYYVMNSTLTPFDNTWSIQVALDITYQQKIIKQYRSYMIIVLICGAVFSILLGYFLSKRGMQRVHELTQLTQKITAKALQTRINTSLWPKEIKDLGIAYNQMLSRIETSMLRLNAFSNDLAHELRTPITNIMGEVELALTTNETSPAILESTLEELQYLENIIENILFLARAEDPLVDLQLSEINISDEVKVVCNYFQSLAEDQDIKIIQEGNANLLFNKIMFRRMMSNILSNSLKYSSSGTVIKITIEKLAKTVEINIKDQGIGISPRALPFVFDRFYRADPSRHVKGMGLGLSIVKSIVDLHGGSIVLNSDTTGTTLNLSFSK